MEVKTYKAYEDIDRFSPVFLFTDHRKKINYVYASPRLSSLDQGIPVCIGVCVNSPLKNEVAKVAISGTVNVRYYGEYPTKPTDVYVITKYKSKEVKGYVSYLCEEITPFIYDNSHIIKVGTLSVNSEYSNPRLAKDAFNRRLISMIISIDNKNYNHSSPHRLDIIPTGRLEGFTFSLYEIGQDLKKGIHAEDVLTSFDAIVSDINQNSPKEQLYNSINNYCENLFYNIPVVMHDVAAGYVKRLSVTMTNGQSVFDSENELRIASNGQLTTIPLTNNSFGVSEFALVDSITNSHLYPYIDTTQDINSWVVGSVFLNPIIGMYDLVKTTINGVSYSVRYCPITDSYNYTVSYFVGLTAEYNKYNSDGFIVRLSWYHNSPLANSIYNAYGNYESIIPFENTILTNEPIIESNRQSMISKTVSVESKKNALLEAIANNDTQKVLQLQNEIQSISDEAYILKQDSEIIISQVDDAANNAATYYNVAVDIKNNSNYAYHVMFYLDQTISKYTTVLDGKQLSNYNFSNTISQHNQLLNHKSEADTAASDYLINN